MKDIFTINEDITFSLDDYKNNHILIVGSPGSGKSTLAAFNILQMKNRNHIIIDPKARMLDLKDNFIKSGYKVKVLNLCDPLQSHRFNPMEKINTDADILELANNLYGETVFSKDPYWDNSAKQLLTSIIGYVHYCMPKEKRNLKTVMEILAKIKEGENGFNVADLFNMCNEAIGIHNFPYEQFIGVNVEAKTTSSCILGSLLSKLSAYMDAEMQSIFTENTLQLEDFTKDKCVLFICIKDFDTSRHPIAGFLLNETIKLLYNNADSNPNGRLNRDIMFWLDDFGSYKIKDFKSVIANARSRGIGFTLMLQSLSQLKTNYSDYEAQSIIECCDHILYTGSNGNDTIRYLSDLSNMRMQALSNLSVNECMFWERGKTGVFTKMIDTSKYPEYCIWKYPHHLIQRNEGNSERIVFHDNLWIYDLEQKSTARYSMRRRLRKLVIESDEGPYLYLQKEDLEAFQSLFNENTLDSLKFWGFSMEDKDRLNKVLYWFDYIPKFYLKNQKYLLQKNNLLTLSLNAIVNGRKGNHYANGCSL